MSIKSFVKTEDWNLIKDFITNEIQNKPLSIDTKDKTPEMIAVEVRASQIAVEKIHSVVKKLELIGIDYKKDDKPWR